MNGTLPIPGRSVLINTGTLSTCRVGRDEEYQDPVGASDNVDAVGGERAELF